MITLLSIFLIAWVCYYILLELFRFAYQDKTPGTLEQTKVKFLMGKPPRKYHKTLRAVEPLAISHYCKVPGRLSCAIRPYDVNGEKLWKLVIGFKSTAESQPTKFIQIPVYADGQIYDA
jgi:hypothetical protein